MRRRGQQGLARCQVDHPGERRTAEGAVDRYLDKVDLLQRIGHRQIGDAVLQHDGDMAGTGIKPAARNPVTKPVSGAVYKGFEPRITQRLARRRHGDAGPLAKARRAVMEKLSEGNSERHGRLLA